MTEPVVTESTTETAKPSVKREVAVVALTTVISIAITIAANYGGDKINSRLRKVLTEKKTASN